MLIIALWQSQCNGQISPWALSSQTKLDMVLNKENRQSRTRPRFNTHSQRDVQGSEDEAKERPAKRARTVNRLPTLAVKQETPILDLTADSDDEMSNA